jgi:hypothetical protein
MKTAQITNRKKAVADFAELNPKIAAQVQSIKEHPEMIAACEKWQDLQKQLADLRKQLSLGFEGLPMPPNMHSIESDAEEVLAGKPAAELPGQSRDTDLQNLRRQEQALARAVEVARSEIQTLDGKLIGTECEKLRPIALRYVEQTFEAFELLRECLERQEKFFTFLSFKGYTQGLRPSGWESTGFEKSLLFGGLGIPCLKFYIELRRKVCHLDKKG